MGDRVITFEASTATVELAAQALGVEPGHIAKTMSFLVDGAPLLVILAGDVRVDNHRFKEAFHKKGRMIPFDQVESFIGYAPGGVCPFAIKEGVPVYLDESLHRFETVYPAAGSSNSAIELSIPELEDLSGYTAWVDLAKEAEA